MWVRWALVGGGKNTSRRVQKEVCVKQLRHTTCGNKPVRSFRSPSLHDRRLLVICDKLQSKESEVHKLLKMRIFCAEQEEILQTHLPTQNILWNTCLLVKLYMNFFHFVWQWRPQDVLVRGPELSDSPYEAVKIIDWASQVALVVKNAACSARDLRNVGPMPGLGTCPGRGHGNPLQYSCLENPMDRGAWR